MVRPTIRSFAEDTTAVVKKDLEAEELAEREQLVVEKKPLMTE